MSWEDFRIHRRLMLTASMTERAYTLLAEIDTLKNNMTFTSILLPQMLQRLTTSVIVTSSGSSNRIEGNTLTDVQIEVLYKNMRIKKWKTRDEQEVVGYLETLEKVFQHYNDIPIRESSLLQLHHDMLVHCDKDQSHKGQYKVGSNRVEMKDHTGNVIGVVFDPTPPYLVKKEIHELVDWYNWALETKAKHPLLIMANFIFEYLAIHPFQDGNGRTSRLLTNLMLLQNGYRFTSLVSHERIIEDRKAEYYLALNQTQKTWKTEEEDITPWLLFFLGVMQTQSQQAMALLEGDTIDHLLSEKQMILWQWAQEIKRPFSRSDAMDALDFPARTVESIIKKLVDLKRLERFGQGNATRYRLLSPF